MISWHPHAHHLSAADLSALPPLSLISLADRERLPERIADAYPLSQLQAQLLAQHDLRGTYDHSISTFRVTARFDQVVLEQTLAQLVARHAVLRTSFALDGFTEPLQLVHTDACISVTVEDLRHLSHKQQQDLLTSWLEAEKSHKFDVRCVPLVRFHVHLRSDETFQLSWTGHQALLDRGSVAALNTELVQQYQQLLRSAASPMVEPAAATLATFVALERQARESTEQQNYWINRLDDSQVTVLPRWNRKQGAAGGRAEQTLALSLSAPRFAGLHHLAELADVPFQSVILAAHLRVLAVLSGQRDIVTGLSCNNRPLRAGDDAILGPCSNTVPFRLQLMGGSWLELVRAVSAQEQELQRFHHFPLLEMQRLMDRQVLFEVVFEWTTVPVSFGATSEPAAADLISFHASDLPLVVSFILDRSTSELHLSLSYAVDEFTPEQIGVVGEYYTSALAAMALNPLDSYETTSLLTDREQQLLDRWSLVEPISVPQPCLHDLFEAQAARRPDAIAVVCDQQQMSYAELDQRANQLAHYLMGLGVGPEVPVGIILDRSVELVVAILGILKAGGAYLPLDPAYPPERLKFMCDDSRATVLIIQTHLREHVPAEHIRCVCIDSDWTTIAQQPTTSPGRALQEDHLAYLIYTSGSTGQPKGTQITHANVTRLFAATQHWFQISHTDVWTLFHSYAFDFSVWELWGALLYGGRLVVVPYLISRSPEEFYRLLEHEHVTVLNQTPSAFQQLMTAVETHDRRELALRLIIFGGEALELESLRGWFERYGDEQPRLVNMYGITETTVFVTYRPVQLRDLDHVQGSMIGRPIPNLQVYILDQALQQVPVGTPGEMYVGGDGLGRGYLNRPDLTAARFIPHPFSDRPGERLYKTGDLARHFDDNDIEYLGRIDQQIKLRGFRIELGEIEAALRQHPMVATGVVLLREDHPGDKRLVAYIVPSAADQGWNAPALAATDQLDYWQSLYNELYDQPIASADPQRNIVGWNSSYTNQPLSDAEMSEWLETTIARLRRVQPSRVLEIGCGTGMLLFRIAPQCSSYVATDLSQAAIDYVERQLALPGQALPQVSLFQRLADDFSGIAPHSFDLVILNSVIQYFPSVDYLIRVLEGAVNALAPGGSIFLGDVRNFLLLEAFQTEVALARAPESLPLTQLRHILQRQMRQEQELLVSPAFFTALSHVLPQIRSAQIMLKRGRQHNELTQFRYDVLLQVGDEPLDSIAGGQQDWQRQGLNLAALREQLRDQSLERLAVVHIPNARIWTALQTLELLKRPETPETVGWLRQAVASRPSLGVDPEDVWDLGDEYGYDVQISWSDDDSSTYDAVFVRRGATSQPPPMSVATPHKQTQSSTHAWHSYTNQPLHARLSEHLVPQVRDLLQRQLPQYMVPSAFVVLEELPLTANGKLDRRALPPPREARPDLQRPFVAPRTVTEMLLASIWAEVLGIDQIGVEDDFFEVGGDSILGIQIAFRVQQAGLKFAPKQLFQTPTIAELASIIAPDVAAETARTIVAGPVPLAPIQAQFFEQGGQDLLDWKQALLIELPLPLDVLVLQQALDHLLMRHDALRLYFEQDSNGWRGVISERDTTLPLVRVTLSGLAEADQQRSVERTMAELSAALDLRQSPQLRVALLDHGAERPPRLLIVINRLAIDQQSQPILLEDLRTAYQQLSSGQPIYLGSATASYRQALDALISSAQSDALARELAYWRAVLPAAPEPVLGAVPTPSPHEMTVQYLSTALDDQETRRLLDEVPRAYRTEVEDLLLAAMLLTFQQSTGQHALLFELETSGRPALAEAMDLTRTIGGFTSRCPLLLQMEPGQRPEDLLVAVKERRRLIPGYGSGYGLLRYLRGDAAISEQLRLQTSPDLRLSYLGSNNQAITDAALPRHPGVSSDPLNSATECQGPRLALVGRVCDGRLQVEWVAYGDQGWSESLEQTADRFLVNLRTLIGLCCAPEAGARTPSDFPLAGLSSQGLKQIAQLLGGPEQLRDVEDMYPLSPMQQGMVFHTLYSPESALYIAHWTGKLRGKLNIPAFQQAWQMLIDHHPSLQIFFLLQGIDQPLQVVRRHVALPWRYQDWRGRSSDEQREQLAALMHADRQSGFALDHAPLLRFQLIQMADDSYQFIWSFHHALIDAWSIDLLLQELSLLYSALCRKVEPATRAVQPYSKYIAWFQRQDLANAEAFWRQTLRGFTTPTSLAVDRVATGSSQPQGYMSRSVHLSIAASEAVQTFAAQHQLTLGTVVQGAWAVLLSRYSGEHKVVFGTVVAGRPETLAGADAMVGVFINTLPTHVTIVDGVEVGAWLKELQEWQLEARQYEHTPLVDIQRWSELPPGQALFESVISVENFPTGSLRLDSGADRIVISETQATVWTNYPLMITITPGAQLAVTFTYDLSRFDAATIAHIGDHFLTLLGRMVTSPEQQLARLPLLTEPEARQILVEWNRTAAAYESGQRLHGLFEAQVLRTPDTVAVQLAEEQLTYDELNRRANQLAHYLVGLGVGPETLVGICAERSLEMVIGLLGILKAGGAYLPLDPGYPAGRLQFMLEDAQVAVLLTQGDRAVQLVESIHSSARQVPHVIGLASDWASIAQQPTQNLNSRVSAESLAYVIYTSGSTGTPKGAMNTHGAICNRLLWMQEQYQLTADDRVLQKTPFSFDVSVWEFFWPLLAGARLVFARPEGHRDSAYLIELIKQAGITTVHFVPSMLQVFLAHPAVASCHSLRQVMCSGEALPYELQQRFFERLDAELHNLYGPTEAAVDVTFWHCQRDSQRLIVPIGRPVANTQIYILDGRHQPTPAGVAGELYIGGVQLARGYWNRPELTAEKFVEIDLPLVGRQRLYRSGDRARFLPDGAIEYLGRLDQQVKIRGFRIEPGEIEAALARHAAIREVIVLAREDSPGDQRLVAYLVTASAAMPSSSKLRSFLQEQLPEYMIPAAFVPLAAMPLSPNGKVDRSALPKPEQARPETGYVAPRTPVEIVLADIWAELLGIERIGVHDHFFHLGGHSLLAIRAVAHLAELFGIELPLRTLFETPTVAGISNLLVQDHHHRARVEHIAQLLVQVAAMSDGEVAESLHQHVTGGPDA